MKQRIRARLEACRATAQGNSIHATTRHGASVFSAWSSAHVALGLAGSEPAAALAELRALYALCQDESGAVALECSLEPATENPLYTESGRSVLIAPPVAAFAAARLAQQLGAGARDVLEAATAQLDAIWGERLPPDTILPVILHPLESGPFGSPLFDGVIDATERPDWDDEAAVLVRSAVACQLQPERALRAGHTFVVEDPVFCGWLLIALEEVGRAWAELGDAAAETKLRIRADMIGDGIVERLWWNEGELFVAFDRLRETPLRAITAGGLVPAASRRPSAESLNKRVIDRYLRPATTALWNERGLAFTPIERERDFDPAELEWRGNAISPVVAYWAHLILSRAQRPADARRLTGQLEALIDSAGACAFYDAISGEPTHDGDPLGCALALEMRQTDG